MLPRDLKAADFAGYTPLAQRFAVQNLAVLQQLPPAFAPLLLREAILYDSKFPAERKDLDRQFAFLRRLAPRDLQQAVVLFAALRLTLELQSMDWVNQPSQFAEQLTAHLWATHQIEAFREAAVAFVGTVNQALPESPEPLPRVGIVVIGKGVSDSQVPLFRKMRPRGTHFTKVQAGAGFPIVWEAVRRRAAGAPIPYGHWYIDGATGLGPPCAALAAVSYESIRPLRAALQSRLQRAWESGTGSEALRTMLAQSRPEEFGLHGDPVFDRFQLTLLTEGSGTQVYSTTFAQWAAREVLRRAQPSTLLVRFAPRQRERNMNEMLAEASGAPPLDPESSLRDADMGAYYTWLNQQRLAGAERAAFLVWAEDAAEALVIAPGVAKAKSSAAPVKLEELLRTCLTP